MSSTPRTLARSLAASALLTAPALAQTFTVIGLPDTQNYSESYPQIFAAQTQWVADNIDALDIRYVSHYGDVVQNGDQIPEWLNADAAMATLDATGVPQGVTPGNHDITPTGFSGQPYIPQYYAQYFGPQRYAGQPWFGGASPSGMSSYQVFSAGGIEFLTLHVECDAAVRELEWAQGVLDANRDKPVLMTTHRYLQDAEDYTFGVPVVPSGRYPGIWYDVAEGTYTPDGIESEDLWRWFIRRNPNVFMVMCGHFHEEYRQVSTNAAGKPVHEILADYQDDPNGGNGWLRIYAFDLANDRIEVDSYSPTLDQWRTADESKFTLGVDFEDYYEWNPTVVFQQGINGYQGTQDTWVNEDAPNTSYGDDGTRISDDDTANGFFSDDRGQALMRFDGIVGSSAGQVPFGATVKSAHLTFDVLDDVDFVFDADFFLHRVFVPWDENSTWNSLGGGLGGGELSPVLAVVEGDNDPDGDTMRRFDVTSTVQDWVNGADNWGFAILPEIVSGNDDGIEIASSENANTILRPRLEIVYERECGYTAYGPTVAPNVLGLTGLNTPSVGTALAVRTTGAPSTAVINALSFAPASLPFAGGTLVIDPAQLYTVAVTPAPTGSSDWILGLPYDGALVGASVFMQSFTFDSAQLEGLALSNGLEATICP